MLRVGLTGGIASGKSTVARMFAEFGAEVVDSDALAREVMAVGSSAVVEAAAAFGDTVLGADGVLDRAALGRVVFADPSARARLEAITHPRIRELTARRFAAASPGAVVVHDIPLLVELGMADRYHLTVVVGASADERVRRLVTERGMTSDDAWSRVRAQADDADRRAAADVWLDNAGAPTDVVERVTALWHDRLVPFEENLRSGRRAVRPDQPVVVASDPSWADQAARLIARVRRAVDHRALDVAHIGSTAVPGLAAKDVIDLQIVVADLQTAHDVAADLAGAGLVAVGGPYWDQPIALPSQRVPKVFAANADPERAVNCHIRPMDSPVIEEALALRDRLRADPTARAAYERLKRDLAARQWPNVDAYAAAKTPFLADLLGGHSA